MGRQETPSPEARIQALEEQLASLTRRVDDIAPTDEGLWGWEEKMRRKSQYRQAMKRVQDHLLRHFPRYSDMAIDDRLAVYSAVSELENAEGLVDAEEYVCRGNPPEELEQHMAWREESLEKTRQTYARLKEIHDALSSMDTAASTAASSGV